MREGATYKRLGEIAIVHDSLRKPVTKSDRKAGIYPYYGATGVQDYVDQYIFDGRYVLVGEDGAKWGANDKSAYIIEGKSWVNNHAHVLSFNDDICDSYVTYFLNFADLDKFISGAIVRKLTQKSLLEISIPVPSLSTQELIVRELDSISSVISAKKQQVLELDNLAQAIFLDMFGDPITNPKGWEVKRWEDAVTIINGRNQAAVECEDGQYPICGSGGEMGRANEYLCPEFSIIIGRKGNINKPIFMREKFWNIDTAFGIVPITDIVNADYLYHFCLHFDFELLNVTVTIPSLRKADLLKIRIPLPPLSLQQAFAEKVQAIEEQKRLINQSIAEFESLLAQRMEFHFA